MNFIHELERRIPVVRQLEGGSVLHNRFTPAVSEPAGLTDLPSGLSEFWRRYESACIHCNDEDGIASMQIHSPADARALTEEHRRDPELELVAGDLEVATFESYLILVVRCDPSADDFGSCFVREQYAGRWEWTPAPPFEQFLLEYMDFLNRDEGSYLCWTAWDPM